MLNKILGKGAKEVKEQEITSHDLDKKVIKVGDSIKFAGKSDDITHLDVYSEASKNAIKSGTHKITEIIISSGRGIVYFMNGNDKVFMYADSVKKIKV